MFKYFLSFCFIFTLPQSVSAEKLHTACDDLKAVQPIVEQVRGLKFKSEINCRVLKEDAFEKLSRDYLFELVSAEEFALQGKVYKLLGLLPESYDYERCYLQNSDEYTEAFYHIFDDEIILPAGRQIAMSLLAHEATHALQDQHFDLGKLARQTTSTDASLSFAALAEGDAKAVQMITGNLDKARNKDKSNTEGQVLRKNADDCVTPGALEDLLFFPYEFGLIFVDRLVQKGTGFSEVDNAFRSYPKTTTEILHRKAFGSFRAKKVNVTPQKMLRVFELKEGVKRVFTDTIGQHTIRLLLGNFLSPKVSILAAKGWEGDRLGLYESDERKLLVWNTAWKNEAEASEFYLALLSVIAQRTQSVFYQESRRVFVHSKMGDIYLERAGTRVHYGHLN